MQVVGMALRLFCADAADARYGWAAKCLEQFGSVPRQILDEWNTVAHVTEFEGQPHRRPLTYDEVQALFDAADGGRSGPAAGKACWRRSERLDVEHLSPPPPA
jgi:hypothetical protein